MSLQILGLNSTGYEESILAESKEILTHTADAKVKVTSETLPSLFRLSLESLNHLLYPDFGPDAFESTITETIDLQAPDTTSLLIDFLSEVLTLSQINKAIFFDFEVNKMTDCVISGTLHGGFVDAFKEDVKAVTYHEADVKVNDRGDWETVIIFDI